MKAEIGKRYRHYKGNEYTVLSIARDESDVARELVIYRAEYVSDDFGDGCVWARERSNWEGTLSINGENIERFTRIEVNI